MAIVALLFPEVLHLRHLIWMHHRRIVVAVEDVVGIEVVEAEEVVESRMIKIHIK